MPRKTSEIVADLRETARTEITAALLLEAADRLEKLLTIEFGPSCAKDVEDDSIDKIKKPVVRHYHGCDYPREMCVCGVGP